MTFRSLDMKHYTLIIPRDHAYLTISRIAQFQTAHFVDAGDHMNRQFQLQLKRVEELGQEVIQMKNAIRQVNLELGRHQQETFENNESERWHEEANKLGVEDIKLIDFYEKEIKQEYQRYSENLGALQKLKLRKKQILQQIACNETIDDCFGNSIIAQSNYQYYQNYMGDNLDGISGISYMLGLIQRQAQNRFNKMIYRISRGYACVKSVDSFNFHGLADFPQKVLIVMYPSSSSGTLQRKIQKVMQMFCKSVVQVNKLDYKTQASATIQQLKTEYEETLNYIALCEVELKTFFKRVSSADYLEKWSKFIWKEKCIYETLNKLQTRGQLLFGNIYVPKQKVQFLSLHLNRISPSPTLQEVQLGNPPTAFSTNEYTVIAQQITDTYGVPRYQQINPTIFTTITFPFFFGVMFGDIGHGLVLFGLGIYLLINDSWLRKGNNFQKMASQMRYMITLMGFFAFYCGWIYNDLIGFNYNFFGSCYDPKAINPDTGDRHIHAKQGCVYPFGIDPIWGKAENQLVYVNSLKMKISVIIAIVHMTFGIILKAVNSLYFKKKLIFYFEFIPQIIFLVALFGYMDFLIIFKWLKLWDEKVKDIPSTQWAPSIISTMMNIALALGKTTDKPDGTSNMWGQRGHSWQDTLQFFILIIAVICIPLMCIPKPYIQISQIKKMKKKNYQQPSSIVSQQGLKRSLLTNQSTSSIMLENEIDSPRKQKEEAHDEGSGQIIVHQLIETIQFVLGAVSNTASYLRLWALSLAHSQLAKVFFQKTLKNTLQIPEIWSGVLDVIMFWMLCWITFGVLMCMDTMECFLHSLRLHWVQFQNKFYKGDGYKYEPVSIRLYIESQRSLENK